MNEEIRRREGVRAAVLIVAVTLLALGWPVGAPLYAMVYPGPDARTINEAITSASLDAKFESERVTQFQTATFRATVIYGTSSPNPDLPTVKIAWSNEAALTAQTKGTFDIRPTSDSRQFLDQGSRRPNGGYELTWTWDVTPLVTGKQTLIVRILPTVVVEGQVIPDLANINKPIGVTIEVHPVQHDFDEVVKAAAKMKTEVPTEMIVGKDYVVSATMSLAGHTDTVSADIDLHTSKDSAEVAIVETSAAPSTARMALAASGGEGIARKWTVTPNKPGQVALVFTATVKGQAATHPLEQKVPKTALARAAEPGPSFWDRVQQPVLYAAPFVALAAGIFGLLAAWKKRKAAGAADGTSGGDPAS
jgi:hypothetical protein